MCIIIIIFFLASFSIVFTVAKYFDLFQHTVVLRRLIIWISVALFIYVRRNNLIISDITYNMLSVYNYFIYYVPVIFFGVLFDLNLI